MAKFLKPGHALISGKELIYLLTEGTSHCCINPKLRLKEYKSAIQQTIKVEAHVDNGE